MIKEPLQAPALHKKLTVKDYLTMTPAENPYYELHDGTLIFMPTPTVQHQQISMRLSVQIFNFIAPQQLGTLLAAPMDTLLGEHTVLQPDILFVSKERSKIVKKRIEGAPDLVVEIISPANDKRELSFKKHIYETHGVKEYWLIDPLKSTLTQYENIGFELFPRQVLSQEDTLQSIVIEGLTINLPSVFVF